MRLIHGGLCWLALGVWAAAAEPVVIAEGAGKDRPQQPQAFAAADGTIDVVHAAGDEIRLATSRDRGATFAPAARSVTGGRLAAGMRRGPRVVRTKSAVIATAVVGEKGGGADGDVTAWRSSDDGATWSSGVRVNAVVGSAREGLHATTASPDGTVWCAWLDLRNRRTEVYASSSDDDGATWGENRLVHRSPDRSVCECCHPSIVAGADGRVFVLFRNSLFGERDMHLARSDDGRTFASAVKLGGGTWTLNACPMDGGMLATDGRGDVFTIWRRANRVYDARPGDAAERDLGRGEQPWAAWSAAGPVAVWTLAREGTLSIRVGRDGPVRTLAEAARDPVVVSRPELDFAVVCCEEKVGDRVRVVARVVSTPAAAGER